MMAGVMAAFYHSLPGGDLFSEASEAFDFQAFEVARPPRLERGTLCLEGRCSIQLSYGRFPCVYRGIVMNSILVVDAIIY